MGGRLFATRGVGPTPKKHKVKSQGATSWKQASMGPVDRIR
jgi:hypothetical protein